MRIARNSTKSTERWNKASSDSFRSRKLEKLSAACTGPARYLKQFARPNDQWLCSDPPQAHNGRKPAGLNSDLAFSAKAADELDDLV